jgi:small neutral amino acid transporter SnatA (MarC family)
LIIALLIILNPVSTVPAYVSMHPHTKTKQLMRDAFVVASGVFVILAIAAIA